MSDRQGPIEYWSREFAVWVDGSACQGEEALRGLLQWVEQEIRSKRIAVTEGDPGFSKSAVVLSAETWVRAYESVFIQVLDRTSPTSARRKSGSFFTPSSLVEPIVTHGLVPVLLKRVHDAIGDAGADSRGFADWTDAHRAIALRQVRKMRVCDPACGAGDFLLRAGEMLADRQTWFLDPESTATDEARLALRQKIAERCLFGVELNPLHAQAARLALWIWCGTPDVRVTEFGQIRAADALAVDDSGQLAIFDQFPEIFADEPTGFDLVLGNPPFANAIEDDMEGALATAKSHREALFSELTGTADLAYYFLVLADRLTKADGAVGLVLPRAVLSASSARSIRTRLTKSRPPTLIYAPPDPYLFPGANIHVTAVVFRAGEVCLGSRDPVRSDGELRLERVVIDGQNWWRCLSRSPGTEVHEGTCKLHEFFEVFASMTTGMAYDLLPSIAEEEELPEEVRRTVPPPFRLVTTGMIEPGVCLWGECVCRYLKQRWRRPVVDPRVDPPASLRDRLQRVRRPKVVVAGLSTKVEAFLDRDGAYCGAVSTWTIVEANDDVSKLVRLCAYLNQTSVEAMLQQELGATAMGGGRITLTKEFLRNLPVPKEFVESAIGANTPGGRGV